MKLKDFKLLYVISLLSLSVIAQNKVSGVIIDENTQFPIDKVAIYERDFGLLTLSNTEGSFQFKTDNKELHLIFLC